VVIRIDLITEAEVKYSRVIGAPPYLTIATAKLFVKPFIFQAININLQNVFLKNFP